MGHIHAAAMAEYAKDATETDMPWERWEASLEGQEVYFALESDPCWATGTKYRRKAKTTLLYDIARCPGVPTMNPTNHPAGAKAAKPACAAPRRAVRIGRCGWSRPPSLAFFVSI